MKRLINRVKLFPNDNDKSREIEAILKEKLEQSNFKIVNSRYELAIAIGGDGSFLRMVRANCFDSSIYYVGINAGTLGFLQEISIDKIDNFIERLNNNDFSVEMIGVQETKVLTNDRKRNKFFSLNEIIVRDKNLKTAKMQVEVDGEVLENFVGDGLLVSTSIGSTAYNLSFGGSIVYDDLHTLELTPIAPLNNKSYRDIMNSVIIPENRMISIKPMEEDKSFLIITDGENNICDNIKKIDTYVRDKKIKIIRMTSFSYATKIREKFLNDK